MTLSTAPVPLPAGKPAAGRRRHGTAALVTGLGLLALAVAVMTGVSLTVGSGDVPLRDVIDAVFDPDRSVRGQLIVQEVRFPRTLAGLLAGVALGLAGALMRGVTRNPLADPGCSASTRAHPSPLSSPSASCR